MKNNNPSLMEESLHLDADLSRIHIVLEQILNDIRSGFIANINNDVLDESIKELYDILLDNKLPPEINTKINTIIRQLSGLETNIRYNQKPLVQYPSIFLLLAAIVSLCYIITNSSTEQAYAITNQIRDITVTLGLNQAPSLESITNEIYNYIQEHNLNEFNWFKDTNSFINTSLTPTGEITTQFPLSISSNQYFQGIGLPIGRVVNQNQENMFYVLSINENMPIEMLEAQLFSLGIDFNLVATESELIIDIAYPNNQSVTLARLMLENRKIVGIISNGVEGPLALRFGEQIDINQFSGARG